MREMQPQGLEWIDRAPVSAVGRAVSTASPEAVFAVLADHERWPEWFPNVRRVEVLGPAAGVGARRRVQVPGLVVEEEFIAWDPGVRWTFTGTAARPGFVRSLVEDCQLEAAPGGGTSISYGMHLGPSRAMQPIVQLSAVALRRILGRATRSLAERAASLDPPTSD